MCLCSATGASGPSRERNGGGTKQWGVPTGTQAATGGGGSGGGPHQHARNSVPTSAPPLEMHSGIGMDPSQYARAGGIQNGGWGGGGAAMGGMSYGAPDGLAPISTGAPPPDCSGSQTWTGLGMMQPANDQYMYGGVSHPVCMALANIILVSWHNTLDPRHSIVKLNNILPHLSP